MQANYISRRTRVSERERDERVHDTDHNHKPDLNVSDAIF